MLLSAFAIASSLAILGWRRHLLRTRHWGLPVYAERAFGAAVGALWGLSLVSAVLA